VNSEEIAQYTSIIDGILATADLATISRKKVRQALERALGGKDLSDQKVGVLVVPSPPYSFRTNPSPTPQNAIKVLIEQRFDAISEAQAAPEAMPTPPHKHDDEDNKNGLQNGTTHMDEDADADADADEDASAGEIQVSTAPSKKRSSSMVEDEDARLARELQAQENRLARGRQTRGGNSTPKAKPKTKTKSSSKVKTGDDSDVDTEDSGTAKKRKAGGGFQKEFNLSFPLQEVVGAERVCAVCCCFVAVLQPKA
jgi:upstream activation factor subunit UAF30